MISIIIVNYNTFEITANCIRSIIDNTQNVDYEIIVVDNASTLFNPEKFLSQFPNIHLIQNHTNYGFAKGNNIGIDSANGDMILLLNNDTYFTENTLYKAYTKFAQLPNPGFLGVKMYYPDGRIQHTARRFRSIAWELLDVFRIFLYIIPYKKRAVTMLGKYFRSDFDVEPDWLNGAFLMFKKDVLKELPDNKLDERFFMYGEDHLWGYQLKNIGLHHYFYCGTSIVHIQNASTSPEKRLQLLRTMFKNELEILKIRKGKGIYYFIFSLIYGLKEESRIQIKSRLKRFQFLYS